MGSELFHADGRTDMTKLSVAFHKFANALKNAFYVTPIIYIHIYTFIGSGYEV
jgi:hypothetical protein